MAQYVLPCPCGRSIEVGTGQAGRTIRCECGTELEVPSIRGLEHLRRATPAEVESQWGLRQAILFIGLLLLTVGFVAGILFYFMRPKLDDYATMRAEVDAWPVEKQRLYWEYMQQYGIKLSTPEDVKIIADDTKFATWSTAGFLVGSVGLALTAGSLLLLGGQRTAKHAEAPTATARKRR